MLVLGLLLSLVVGEALLQAGALVVRWTGHDRTVRLGTDPRVLFLGDSNTYGLYVEREQAYPSIFETEWNSRKDVAPVQAINLGFPGTNSRQVRNILRPVLHAVEPRTVVVMLGANDFWTQSTPAEVVQSRPADETAAQTLWRHSRVFRLLYMLRQSLAARRIEIDWKSSAPLPTDPGASIPDHFQAVARVADLDVELGWNRLPEQERGDPYAFLGPLRENLAEIVAEVQRDGAEPVLVTYPSDRDVYAPVNAAIRATAKQVGCELVDLALVFRELCPQKECAFFFPDGHPTAAGHARVGRILVRKLREK